ncbi:MAG: DUF1540 domain-containing protein [Firmicutes bacterium]|nr:DUF1540 domain-containing protein [Bacillota bacterium]
MPEVRCKVDSCVFWGKGDHCTASEIWVNHNMESDEYDELHALGGFGLELADDMESISDEGKPLTSRQTCCETMRPKERIGGGGGGCCR